MKKWCIAIVGRPNVGKSTLFNSIIEKKVAIIDETSGTTRDRIFADSNFMGKTFRLIDTAGFEEYEVKEHKDGDDISFTESMRKQIKMAGEEADIICFLVDGKEGLTPLDKEVAKMLRKTGKKIIVAVNKVDNFRNSQGVEVFPFYELGFSDVLPVSATLKIGIGDLLEELLKDAKSFEEEDENESDVLKIAIIGKPNAGKSTLINKLTKKERAIVSSVPGTTRDIIDEEIKYKGRKIILIDTAGIRRHSKIASSLENVSVLRAKEAIKDSDITVLMIDSEEGITDQDKRIIQTSEEEGKGLIIAFNKWDIVDKDEWTMFEKLKDAKGEFAFAKYAKYLFISAKTGQRVNEILDDSIEIFENLNRRIQTAELNTFIQNAVLRRPPNSHKGKNLKIFYVSQIGVMPPLFSFQINSKEQMHFSYARYLENELRKGYDFSGSPIRFVFRDKSR